MKKIFKKVVLSVVVLLVTWFIFLPPYLEVFQEDGDVTILINFFEFKKNEFSEIALWTEQDSLVWKIEAVEESFKISDMEFRIGQNSKEMNIPDSLLQGINIRAPKGDSVYIESGGVYRVVIKKPGLDKAWLKRSKSAEYIFTAQ
ncbi:MAG: hypothetical protein OCC49_08665 [Fibrobacterales bacterium]